MSDSTLVGGGEAFYMECEICNTTQGNGRAHKGIYKVQFLEYGRTRLGL